MPRLSVWIWKTSSSSVEVGLHPNRLVTQQRGSASGKRTKIHRTVRCRK